MAGPFEFVRAHRARFEEDLCALLRIPSISTLPEHREDMQRAARWIADRLAAAGIHAEVVPTRRHPLVYAERQGAPGRPTVLCYCHYDVQPADPLELWTSPPFEPVVRGGACTRAARRTTKARWSPSWRRPRPTSRQRRRCRSTSSF